VHKASANACYASSPVSVCSQCLDYCQEIWRHSHAFWWLFCAASKLCQPYCKPVWTHRLWLLHFLTMLSSVKRVGWVGIPSQSTCGWWTLLTAQLILPTATLLLLVRSYGGQGPSIEHDLSHPVLALSLFWTCLPGFILGSVFYSKSCKKSHKLCMVKPPSTTCMVGWQSVKGRWPKMGALLIFSALSYSNIVTLQGDAWSSRSYCPGVCGSSRSVFQPSYALHLICPEHSYSVHLRHYHAASRHSCWSLAFKLWWPSAIISFSIWNVPHSFCWGASFWNTDCWVSTCR